MKNWLPDIPAALVISAVILAAAFLFAHRFTLVTTGDKIAVWRVDRLTGKTCVVMFSTDNGVLLKRCLSE